MKNHFIFLLFLFSQISFAQQDSLNINNYLLILNGKQLNVLNKANKILLKKEFTNPYTYTSDLDDDGNPEYLVIDSIISNQKPSYTLYIFEAFDKFSLIDSIPSGSTEPYETNNGDLGGTIIITGNPDFEQFNKSEDNFLPLNCWRYEDSAIFLVNDEVYSVFLNENESIMDYLDESLDQNKNCEGSQSLIAPIAAAYANYINAGEKSVASQFLKNYYLCKDINQFKEKLDALLIKGNE